MRRLAIITPYAQLLFSYNDSEPDRHKYNCKILYRRTSEHDIPGAACGRWFRFHRFHATIPAPRPTSFPPLCTSISEPPKVTQHHPSSVDMVIIDALLRKADEMSLVMFLSVSGPGCAPSSSCLYVKVLFQIDRITLRPQKRLSGIDKTRAKETIKDLGKRFHEDMTCAEVRAVSCRVMDLH